MFRRVQRRSSGQGAGRLATPVCILVMVLGVSAVVLMPAPALAVRISPDRPPASGLPWLMVNHDRIEYSSGQTVILRGFNDDSLLQIGSASLPAPLSATDAALMEAEGFNVVRIPISWSLLEPTPGHFSQTYLEKMEAMVNLCAQHHLYTILDMHTEDFGVAFGGSGAPSWLGVPDIPDLHFPGLTATWQRHLSPAVNAALAYFWLYPNWQKLYWQAWSVLAQRFAGNSNVAGYDLYNEPHPLPIPPSIFDTRILWPFYAKGLSEISKVDPNHLFVLEGDLFGDYPTAVRPLHAADLVYSTHLYAGALLGGTFKGNSKPLSSELEEGLEEASQVPAPYWAGELGINKSQPDSATWARDEIALSNEKRTGWAWWEWDDRGDWGVKDGNGPPDMTWLRVLAQPFVRAAPGRLRSMSYDASTGTLTASITGAKAGALVQLAWPETAGTATVTSDCVQLRAPQQASSGALTLRMLSSSCQFKAESAPNS